MQPSLFATPSSEHPYSTIMEQYASYISEVKPVLDSPQAVARLLRPTMTGKLQEELHVLLLSTKNRLLADIPATIGLADRSQVHPREVFRAAICGNASRILLVHNHPSGDCTPSAADLACTRQLVAAGKVIGIEVTDHVVLGAITENRPDGYISLRAEGLMEPDAA
jgi:DNA repair protein RadC